MSRRPIHFDGDRRETTLCAVCIAIGISIGVAGSHWWPWGPWGFAPEPASAPAWQPRPGEVLVAGPDAAILRDVADIGEGDRLALVVWLRGRSGSQALRVTGCNRGGGMLIDTAAPHSLERWRTAGQTIHDLIGRAACAADLQPAPSSASPRGVST